MTLPSDSQPQDARQGGARWPGTLLRLALPLGGLLLAWQLLVQITGVPSYILPDPGRVAETLVARWDLLARHALVTATEILAGLLIGFVVGTLTALSMAYWRRLQPWLMPALVASQAVPVFALAPLLVLWLGYGMGSKVAMAALIIFFPVTAAFLDGLRRTEPAWLDLARSMNASRWAMLRHIALPAALPALASGLRVAAAVAPIGAVVGEWVGSSAGLGFLMLQANGRMQTDVMFAALFVLAALALALYFSLDALLRRLLPWQREALTRSG